MGALVQKSWRMLLYSVFQTLNFCPRAPPLLASPSCCPFLYPAFSLGPGQHLALLIDLVQRSLCPRHGARSALFLTLILCWLPWLHCVGPLQPSGSALSSVAPTHSSFWSPCASIGPLCLSCRKLYQVPLLQCPLECPTGFFPGHIHLPPGSTCIYPSLLGALPFTTFSLTWKDICPCVILSWFHGCLFYFPTWIFISSRMKQSYVSVCSLVSTPILDTKERQVGGSLGARQCPGRTQGAPGQLRLGPGRLPWEAPLCRPPGRDSPGWLLPLHLVSIMLQSVHLCEEGGVGSLIFLPQDVLELLSSWRPCKRRAASSAECPVGGGGPWNGAGAKGKGKVFPIQ